jgi:hypothetical protein
MPKHALFLLHTTAMQADFKAFALPNFAKQTVLRQCRFRVDVMLQRT